ncbi:MAG: cytochrome c nitrite reductase small subunit [Myxococcales bacterium]|nr:cytochrome c nitrite reductase small subunit [Myxococcales bacterium]
MALRRRFSLAWASGLGLSVLVGLAAGVAGYTFVYARGASYLTDDPEACANCHIMREQLNGWRASSHRTAAVCNDCHTPHGFWAKYWTKARNGFHHSVAFTTGDFAEPIRIKEHNREMTEGACRSCHRAIVVAIGGEPGSVSCVRCHREVGHP